MQTRTEMKKRGKKFLREEYLRNSQKLELDSGNKSDAEALTADTEVLPCDDDALAVLEGLNSDNLMQFSQQSALEELMRTEEVKNVIGSQSGIKDIKIENSEDMKTNIQHLDVLPTIEEHDIGGYKFEINCRSQRNRKNNWIYSETLNKVYIRMNDPLSLDVYYTPKYPLQKLRIRAMLTFVKEISEPVERCQNHMSKDHETSENIRQSLLRCENPSVEYNGSANGKSINERFSVLIPLPSAIRVPNGSNESVKQTIALKFTCQNSCIGRKETALVFLLEGMNGEILSQKVLDIKICSCPKRDINLDEKNTRVTKRKSENDITASPMKLKRQDGILDLSQLIDSDFNDDSGDERMQFSFERTATGRYRLCVESNDKDVILCGMEAMRNKLAYKHFFKGHQQHSPLIRKVQRLHEKALKM